MTSSAIAIDGPVASGKSTVGRRVAAALGRPFVDTGTMYRAFTWFALQQGVDPADASSLERLASEVRMQVLPPRPGSSEQATVLVNGEDATAYLRAPAVERAVSLVSAVPGVRRQMVALQRSFADQGPLVMAGRDIGTVVLPDAPLKVFLDASAETRAGRRAAELAHAGQLQPLDQVLDETRRRDRLDSERADSPLRPAADAVRIQTDELSEDEVVRRVLDLARAAFGANA